MAQPDPEREQPVVLALSAEREVAVQQVAGGGELRRVEEEDLRRGRYGEMWCLGWSRECV